jgi:hypothetical protein
MIRGSTAAAAMTPPIIAPVIPALDTSWPVRKRPGTGVRARKLSDRKRLGLASKPYTPP